MSHKNSAGVGLCTLVSAGFFWLLVVIINLIILLLVLKFRYSNQVCALLLTISCQVA